MFTGRAALGIWTAGTLAKERVQEALAVVKYPYIELVEKKE